MEKADILPFEQPVDAEDVACQSLPSNWTAVVAVARNGVMGRGDALPWKLGSDLKRFKRLTMGHCLLMGRKTFQSIGRPLPGRQMIVLSRSSCETMPSAHASVCYASSLASVPQLVEPKRLIFVVGGAQIYELALPYCSTLWLTRVLADVEGDTYFPEIDWSQWNLAASESVDAGEQDQWPTEFQVWTRILHHD